MNHEDFKRAKASILRCLTEDFTYGKTRKGAPLKRPKVNQRIFDAKRGYAVFNGTDLTMVMDAVVLGLSFALGQSEEEKRMADALITISCTPCYECEAKDIARGALGEPGITVEEA